MTIDLPDTLDAVQLAIDDNERLHTAEQARAHPDAFRLTRLRHEYNLLCARRKTLQGRRGRPARIWSRTVRERRANGDIVYAGEIELDDGRVETRWWVNWGETGFFED